MRTGAKAPVARLLVVAAIAIGSRALAAPEQRCELRPADTGAALVNPDMGWTMHFYSNIPEHYGSRLAPADTLDDFPGLSTVYLRVPWAYLEPEEGRFNWALLDTPAQRWISKGRKVALRVTCSENWLRFATPEWVRRAGARGCLYRFGKGPSPDGEAWDPVFDDPVFLGKLDRFLATLAARYDGNPNVAFVDVGSYGLWGEGHTLFSSRVPEARARRIAALHVDLYARHFTRTLLCINDDFAGPQNPGAHFPETDYALSRGMALRDDSILVQRPPKSWFHAEMAQAFWPLRPVILEHEHYGMSKARGAWGDGALLLRAVEEYHASYMSIHWWPREELAGNRAVVDSINRRLGYRLQLREISWPREAAVGRPFAVHAVWADAGVAPCYPGGFETVTLKDGAGGIVAVLVDDTVDMRELRPGPPGSPPLRVIDSAFTAGLVAPVTGPGPCGVFVSVGRRDGTPRIALPLAGDDGQHRYWLGTIVLTGANPGLPAP